MDTLLFNKIPTARKCMILLLFIILFVAVTIFGALLIFCIYPKSTISFPTNVPDNYTKLRYRGLGINPDYGWFGYIPVEFEFPISQEYPVSINRSETRKLVILKNLGDNEARCSIEDRYPNGTLRAKGTGKVYYTVFLTSCAVLEYFDVVFFDPFGKEVSRIENGTGTETFRDESNQNIFVGEYIQGQLQTVSFWNKDKQLLYSGRPPLPSQFWPPPSAAGK